MGIVKLSNGYLEFVNTIDISAIEKELKHLRASLNSFLTLHPGHGDHKILVDKMIADLELFKASSEISLEDTSRGKALSNMNNDVNNLINRINRVNQKLSESKEPQNGEFLDIKDKFSSIMKILQSNKFDEKLLTLSQLKEGLQQLNIPEDSRKIYGKLDEIGKVSVARNTDEKVLVSVGIHLLDDESFNLWKIIGFPMVKNSNIVTLQNDHKFLLTSFSPKIKLVSSNALRKMVAFQGISVLEKTNDFKKLDERSCLAGIFEGQSDSVGSCEYESSFENIEIFQHLGNYRYLFAIRDSTQYTFMCPGMNHNIGEENYIQGTGILTMNEDCTFKTESTELKSIKVDVFLEPQDKYKFSEVFDRIMENLNKSVLKDPPAFLPLTKLTSNFDSFFESRRKIEEYQEEIDDLFNKLEKPMPTRIFKKFWN